MVAVVDLGMCVFQCFRAALFLAIIYLLPTICLTMSICIVTYQLIEAKVFCERKDEVTAENGSRRDRMSQGRNSGRGFELVRKVFWPEEKLKQK